MCRGPSESHRKYLRLCVGISGFATGFLFLAALLSLNTPDALAHRAGKAIPKIQIQSVPVDPQGGLTHEITVTIVDADSGAPVSGANVTVEAEMTVPHEMKTLPLLLSERDSLGVYIGTLRYPMPAEWTLRAIVEGDKVQQATAETLVSVKLTSKATPSSSTEQRETSPGSGRASVVVRGSLSTSDALPVSLLVLHSIFAIAWAASTLLLALGAGRATSQWFSPQARRRILERGSAVRKTAFAAGVLLVMTGVANGFYAAPFRLSPTPSSIREGMGYPFGSLYLLILAGKIIVLAALVRLNWIPALPKGESSEFSRLHSAARVALAADLVLFPLLLVLITLLRYVHVLVHVSLAVQ